MNSFFMRNIKNKSITFAVCIGIYIVLQLLSSTILNDIYTFEWMARNLYCYTWLPVIVLIVFNKTLMAYFITIGNLVGTIIGELLGSFLREKKMSEITSDMNGSEIALRSYHQGVFIWLITLLIFFLVGLVLSIILSILKKRNHTAST